MKVTKLTLSMGEVLSIAELVPENNHSRTYHRRNSFCRETYEEALQSMRSGYEYKGIELDRIYQKTKALQDFKEDAYTKDVTGLFFDTAEVLQGIPECWSTMTEEAPKKALDIFVDFPYHCNIDPETVFNRGAVVVALVEKLSENYAINLYAVMKTTSGWSGNGYSHEINIKLKTNPISIDEIAFVFTSPAFLRRIYFGLAETWEGKRELGGYGHNDEQPELKKTGLYIPYPHYNNGYETPERAHETIMKMVYEQLYKDKKEEK